MRLVGLLAPLVKATYFGLADWRFNFPTYTWPGRTANSKPGACSTSRPNSRVDRNSTRREEHGYIPVGASSFLLSYMRRNRSLLDAHDTVDLSPKLRAPWRRSDFAIGGCVPYSALSAMAKSGRWLACAPCGRAKTVLPPRPNCELGRVVVPTPSSTQLQVRICHLWCAVCSGAFELR